MILGLTLMAAGCADHAGPLDPSSVDTKRVQRPPGVPDHATLTAILTDIVHNQANGGFGLDMWASIVNREGKVVDVVFSGEWAGDQWPGSRVISAQKANAANAFSLEGLALSTANLYTAVQPGGTLFGLQESNPVDPDVAYGGKFIDYGTEKDFMIGRRIGGINVFGGGLALYAANGDLLGGIGVSGDASCADHNVVWKLRDALKLDYVPSGVSATGDDNIVYDIVDGTSPSGWGHPTCSDEATAIGTALPTTHPISQATQPISQ